MSQGMRIKATIFLLPSSFMSLNKGHVSLFRGIKYPHDVTLSGRDLWRVIRDTWDQSPCLNIFDEVSGNWYCHYKDGSHIESDRWLNSFPFYFLFFSFKKVIFTRKAMPKYSVSHLWMTVLWEEHKVLVFKILSAIYCNLIYNLNMSYNVNFCLLLIIWLS